MRTTCPQSLGDSFLLLFPRPALSPSAPPSAVCHSNARRIEASACRAHGHAATARRRPSRSSGGASTTMSMAPVPRTRNRRWARGLCHPTSPCPRTNGLTLVSRGSTLSRRSEAPRPIPRNIPPPPPRPPGPGPTRSLMSRLLSANKRQPDRTHTGTRTHARMHAPKHTQHKCTPTPGRHTSVTSSSRLLSKRSVRDGPPQPAAGRGSSWLDAAASFLRRHCWPTYTRARSQRRPRARSLCGRSVRPTCGARWNCTHPKRTIPFPTVCLP
jgi:hypothetical protein